MDFSRLRNTKESGHEHKDGHGGGASVDHEYLAVVRGRSERVYRGMTVVIRSIEASEAHEDRTLGVAHEHATHAHKINKLANTPVRKPFEGTMGVPPAPVQANVVDQIATPSLDAASMARQQIEQAYGGENTHVG